ncbi:uncharacterized protein MYCFIDRAFT_164595, partial [Pseudocercospora fijiensis CIRAD86]
MSDFVLQRARRLHEWREAFAQESSDSATDMQFVMLAMRSGHFLTRHARHERGYVRLNGMERARPTSEKLLRKSTGVQRQFQGRSSSHSPERLFHERIIRTRLSSSQSQPL